MNLKSVAVVVFQSKDLTGGESERGEKARGGRRREGEGQREGGQKGRLETVLFLY